MSLSKMTTDVYVSFNLLAINGLDMVTETLKTTGFLFIEWSDEHLVWNASDFGGIDAGFWPQVRLPFRKVSTHISLASPHQLTWAEYFRYLQILNLCK